MQRCMWSFHSILCTDTLILSIFLDGTHFIILFLTVLALGGVLSTLLEAFIITWFHAAGKGKPLHMYASLLSIISHYENPDFPFSEVTYQA